jgi:uncharacterized phage-associated protein
LKLDHRHERMSNIILFFVTRTRQCSKTHLMHLLYLLDFEHFKATGRSMTDSAYCALPSGPAPAELYWMLHRPLGQPCFLDNLIDDADTSAEHSVLLPQRAMDDDDLTRRQISLLEELAKTYGDDPCARLSRVVCAVGTPWHQTYREGRGQCAHIPYELALAGRPDREQILKLAQGHQQHVVAAQCVKRVAF